jgi:hypothetical protein
MSRSTRYVWHDEDGNPTSDRKIHEKRCDDKRHFATWAQAKEAARIMNRKYASGGALGQHFNPYRCTACGRYTVGAESYHERKKPKR